MQAVKMFLLFLLFSSFFIACGGSGGSVIENSSEIKSTSLSLVAGGFCPGSETSCTPENLNGRIFAAGAMLGDDPDPESNYNMTFLAASKAIIEDPSKESHPPGESQFNLKTSKKISGLISIPTEDNMPSNPVVTRIETYFDYIDATVTLEGTNGIDDTYVIRTVMRVTAEESDVTGIMKVGDKLIKKANRGKFRWCDNTDCNHSTRPDNPLQDENILNVYEEGQSQPGNPNYALYSIDLIDSFKVTHEEISDTTRLWSVDFRVTDALNFKATPSTFSSEKDLIENFSLGFGCNIDGCRNDDKRIRATMSIGKAGSAG